MAALVANAPEPSSPEWTEADLLSEQAYDLREEAVGIEATTLEGMKAKARNVVANLEPESLAADMAISLARDVLARLG